MWNTGARIYTAWIWEKLHGREPPRPEFSPAEVLVQLEPYDLEDLIYTWMQVSIWRCRRRAAPTRLPTSGRCFIVEPTHPRSSK
jgi:hypothetical protein